MASSQQFVDYLLDQMQGAGELSARKMFGEYAVYCNGKVAALVCDDRLFIKPTEPGRAFISTPEEAPAYPGAKNSFLIPEDLYEDRERLRELVRITAEALPLPIKKTKKKKK